MKPIDFDPEVDGYEVDDDFCSLKTKPRTVKHCNLDPCPTRLVQTLLNQTFFLQAVLELPVLSLEVPVNVANSVVLRLFARTIP